MSFAPAGGGFGPPSMFAPANSGLPFAGVPAELQAKAAKILEGEPTHPDPAVSFDQAVFDRRPFSLRRMLSAHIGGFLFAIALVVVEALSLQAGGVLTRWGIDDGILRGNRGVVIAAALAFMGSVVVSSLTGTFRLAQTGRLGERLLYELRIRVFAHLQRLSLDFYTEERAGRVMTRMTSDIEALSQLLQEGLVNLVVQGFTLVVVAAIMFTLEPTLAAITIVVIVPALLAVSLWFRSASDKGYATVRNRIAEVLADLSENLAGVRVITAFNRSRHNVVAHRNVAYRYREANVHTAKVNAIYGPTSELIGNLGQVVVLVVGGRMALDGRLTIGELAAFVLYLTAFFAPVQQLIQLYSIYQSGQAAVTKLRELLGTEPDVPEADDAVVLPRVRGQVEFRGITFGYDPARPVLHTFDLTIEAGETIALVGPTGAGKSTAAKLAARFYDPAAGSVLVDGHDLRSVTFASLRSQLGVVPQEPFLFAGTLRHNLAYGRPDATEAELLAVAQAVGIDDLVRRSPQGLDQVVHERGVSFSSGERQLLALARAMLNHPRILILDEATSNLDLASEARIERALDAALADRTAIIIAHRLATAMRADRIGVIADGRLVELGTHDELVRSEGRYSALYAAHLAAQQ